MIHVVPKQVAVQKIPTTVFANVTRKTMEVIQIVTIVLKQTNQQVAFLKSNHIVVLSEQLAIKKRFGTNGLMQILA